MRFLIGVLLTLGLWVPVVQAQSEPKVVLVNFSGTMLSLWVDGELKCYAAAKGQKDDTCSAEVSAGQHKLDAKYWEDSPAATNTIDIKAGQVYSWKVGI